MNISTVDQSGNNVNIVNVEGNGSQIYVTYKDSSNNLKVDRLYLSGNGTIIGTSASIIA